MTIPDWEELKEVFEYSKKALAWTKAIFCWQLRKFSRDQIHSTALPALRFGFLGLKTFLQCIAVFPSSAFFLHHPFIIQWFILSRSRCGRDRVSLRNATLLLCKILSHQLEISQGKKTFWKFLLELRLKNYFQHYFVITSKMFNPSLFFCRIKVVYIKLLQLSLPLLWNMTLLNWSVHEFWPALVNLNKIDHPEQAFVKPFSSSVEPCYESAMCCWSHLGGGLFQSATWESNLNSGK